MRIRAARADEAEILSELAIRSKAYWGYDEAFMAACADELTLAPSRVETVRATVAERDGRVLGFGTLEGEPPEGALGMLFVAPDAIGGGVGRSLYEHIVSRARELGFTRLTIDADPNAEPFYLAMGAVRIGATPSGSIPGRVLPLLEVALSDDAAPPRSVEEAIAAERAGRPPRYLFFWGHRPRRDGAIGPSCLSQWWEAPFTADGQLFRTAEHYMMAHKAWLFGDEETAERILAVAHPNAAKALGRAVRGFDDELWTARRFEIVVRGNIAKFGAGPDLTAFLLGTRNRVLVEASPYDRIWGIGLAADDERAAGASTWRGQNLLGFALMQARDVLGGGGTSITLESS
ncbi:GNAT family N-acetyltransferase [Microtetraspora malaysiensis]|uniref:GNAT family N-acetyltransferase n=1 Tax=Microtetraspora malaysiensis TaxID=161358 RepID=UPI003D8A8B63